MNFNSLIGYIQKHSLPMSKTKVEVPAQSFTIEAEMITEGLFIWLQNCEAVKSIKATHLIDGVAHNVSITLDTIDGAFELLEVE